MHSPPLPDLCSCAASGPTLAFRFKPDRRSGFLFLALVHQLPEHVEHYAEVGRITAFDTTPEADFVQGDASKAYDPALKRFTRSILFVKPDLIVILDQISTGQPETFQWYLHSPTEMRVGEDDVRVSNGEASCRVTFLAPAGLKLSRTDQFDRPPRERIKLTEYHLTAETTVPAAEQHFVTVIQPFRSNASEPDAARMEKSDEGYIVVAKPPSGGRRVRVILDRAPGERDIELLVSDGQAGSSNR